jgi:hypothetical protein
LAILEAFQAAIWPAPLPDIVWEKEYQSIVIRDSGTGKSLGEEDSPSLLVCCLISSVILSCNLGSVGLPLVEGMTKVDDGLGVMNLRTCAWDNNEYYYWCETKELDGQDKDEKCCGAVGS